MGTRTIYIERASDGQAIILRLGDELDAGTAATLDEVMWALTRIVRMKGGWHSMPVALGIAASAMIASLARDHAEAQEGARLVAEGIRNQVEVWRDPPLLPSAPTRRPH